MPTELLSRGMKTESSYSASPSDFEIQAWSELGSESWGGLDHSRSASAFAPEISPVQTEGESEASHQIEVYLSTALRAFASLASNSPRHIRMIASSEARTVSMGPWKIKNERRLDLIRLKFSVGLDAEKEAELEKLKQEIYGHMQAVDPRPAESLDEIDARFEKMKKRLEAKRGKKGNASGAL